jgi:phosphatidylglycerophosphatase A
MKKLIDKTVLFLATGCGISLVVPFAPGTFGSLPGVALAYALAFMPFWAQIAACLALTLLAVPVCGRAEVLLSIRDDGRISADEWMLYPIALVGLPILSLPWWAMAVFFAVVRLIDIIKPSPAKRLQSLPGGYGVVADDLIANLYSLAINWLIMIFLFR